MLGVLLISVVALTLLLPEHPRLVAWYDLYIFYPLQTTRMFILKNIPFSVGDVLYVAGGIWALVRLIRWVYFLARFRKYKGVLGRSVLGTINIMLAVYLVFLAGWGANYYKPPLAESWGLVKGPSTREKDSAELVRFHFFLIDKLNGYAPAYAPVALKEVNERARKYYGQYTDSRVKNYGLYLKPAIFGYFMERLAIEGYYNPFTGEGQVNSALPAFMMPFIITHEMAHQAGIAAEGDANLMAYALATATDDPTFRYSGYLNIWLYTHNRVFRRDSTLARNCEQMLNPLTRVHIDTIRLLSKAYQNDWSRYSSEIYDSYLRMQQQQEGIKSYSNVSGSAWLLEQQRLINRKPIILIP